jgi:Tfp pilus assembly protein PilF
MPLFRPSVHCLEGAAVSDQEFSDDFRFNKRNRSVNGYWFMRVLNKFESSWVLVLVIWMGVASCASADSKKENHYKKGINYVSSGQYPEAVVEFKNVIQLDPDDGNAKYQLGLVYIKIGGLANLQNAFRLLTEAVEKQPNLMDAQAKLGSLYLLSNDLDKAKEKSDWILAKVPNHVEALLVRAKISQKQNHFDEAEEIYQKALGVDPKRLATYYELAGFYLMKNNREEGESVLKKAFALDPKSVDTHLALARFYQSIERKSEAEAFYQKALTLSPQNKPLYLLLANFYLLEKRTAEAESKLIELTKLDPKDPGVLLALGDFYLSQRNEESAEKAYRQAKDVKPGEFSSRKKLADLYLNQGKQSEAGVLIDEILAHNASDPSGLLLKGRLLLLGRQEGATELFRKVIQIDPSAPSVHYFLGIAFLL